MSDERENTQSRGGIYVYGVAPLMFLAVATDDPIVSYVLNGLATLFLGLLLWIGKQAIRTLKEAHDKLDHLDACMDRVQEEAQKDREAYRLHRQEAEERDKEIAELKTNYAGLEGWAKGRAGLAIDAPITAIPPATEVKS